MTLPAGRLVWIGALVLLACYCAVWIIVAPGLAIDPALFALPFVGVIGAIISNTSAARRPAMRIFSCCSGVLIVTVMAQ